MGLLGKRVGVTHVSLTGVLRVPTAIQGLCSSKCR